MALYTIGMQDIVEMLTPDMSTSPMYERCDSAVPLIFDFNFPIYSEEHRRELCRKILAHYLSYEIGCETFALWKFRLTQKMNDIMPYYNELYKSVLTEFDDSLYDVDITVEKSGSDTDSHVGNVKSETNDEFTDTVDGTSGIDASTRNEANVDATNTQTGTEKNTESGTDSSTETQKHTGTVGTSGSSKSKNDIISGGNASGTKTQSDFPQSGKIGNIDYASGMEQTEESHSEDRNESLDTSTNSTSTNDLTDTVTKSGTKSNVNELVKNLSDTKNESTTGSGTEKRTETKNETVKHTQQSGSKNSTTNDTTHTYGSKTRTHGFQGSKSKSELAMEFRKAIINVDMMIIEELKDLFMLVYDNEIFG